MAFNLTTNQIAESFGVDRKTVKKWVINETFKYGKHYIDLNGPNAFRTNLRFDLDACQKVFLVPPEKR